MTIYNINVQEPYISFLLSGKKTVEGRLNKGQFKVMQIGDILNINGNAKFKLVDRKDYKTFTEMIKSEGISNVIPDKNNIEDAVQVYYRFYTKEQEEEFGVVAVKVQKLDNIN